MVAHVIECSNKIDIFVGKIHCTVRMFRHGETLLLPQAHRNMHYRDETRRGKHHFVPISCSGSNLASFPLGCTAVPGPELGTRLWFVDWITDETAPLSLPSMRLWLLFWPLTCVVTFTLYLASSFDANSKHPSAECCFLPLLLLHLAPSTSNSKTTVASSCSKKRVSSNVYLK